MNYVRVGGYIPPQPIEDYNDLPNIPVISQDLTASGFTPIANTYYKHTGTTTASYTNGVIYYYNSTGYIALDGSAYGLATVAKTGSYNDLSNKPTIPDAANNGTLTIQKNGTNVAIFGANQSSSVTANITVPTKASDVNALPISGGSITGDLTVGGNLTINGTTTTVDSTTLQVKDKLIEVAHGNTTTLTTPAGLVAPKYDGTNSGALVFDSTGTAYVGDVKLDSTGNIDVAKSELQPLATRTGLVGGNLVQYDSSAQTLKDSGKKISDLALTSQLPTVNNGKLTIQKNGTTVETFTANQSANTTANITVPIKVSELTNDSGYTTNKGTVTSVSVKMNDASKGTVTSSGTIDLGTVLTDASKFATSAQGTKADNAMPKSGGTFTGEVKFGNTENFQGYYIKRMIGSLGIGTAYNNLDSSYKDGTWHRMWRLRFPSGSNFWGKIKITLYGGFSSFNASGVMSKSITCNFNTSNIYNNVGCYDGLGVNVEQDFRISEAIWNATVSAWEVLIWQKNLRGNNSPAIMLECWTRNDTNYINAFNGIAAQPVELTQMTSYSAQRASSTGGTKTVTWAALPVYENPLGEEIATVAMLEDKQDKITSSNKLSSLLVDGLGAAAAKAVDTTISANSTSTNLPTSKAVEDRINAHSGIDKVGTITGITMNGESKGTSDVVDLGTVLTDASKFATSEQGTKADNAMPKSGGEFTGGISAPNISTGTDAANYFQSQKFRGEGDANTYYHAVDFGYAGHNQVDFHEYGGVYNFHQNTVGNADGGSLVGAFTPDGIKEGNQLLKDKYLGKSGGTITGDLTVGGNFTVSGTTTTVDSTTLKVSDKLIEVAKDNTVKLTTPAGIVVPKYDGTSYGALVIDGDGNAQVGDVKLDTSGNIDVANSDLQILATRTGLVGGNLVQYDSSALTLKDSGKKISDLALKTDIPNTAKHSSKQLATNTDLNTLNSSDDIGWYHVGGGNSCAHKPTGVDAFGLEVGRSAEGYYFQVLTDGNAHPSRRYVRTYGSAWTAWQKLAITSEIPAVNDGTLTIQKNGTDVATFTANQSSPVTANITVPTEASDVNALSLDGGTINKSKTIKMDASANSDGANLKWGTVNSKNPYIGYASDQVDGTFVVGSLLGTNYASGLAIGGGSGNLLWKGTKVATTSDIPDISGKANSADLAKVATSGSYNDLSNRPSIPVSNTTSDRTPSQCTANGFYYVTSSVNSLTDANGNPFLQYHTSNNDFRILATAYSDSWVQQIATDFRSNHIFYRIRNNGTWGAWKKMMTAEEFSLSGTTLTITL